MLNRLLRITSASAAASLLTAGALAQLCTQSTDPMTINNGTSVHCGPTGTNFHVANSYIRRYRQVTDCQSPNGMTIGGITYGIEIALAGMGAGMQPINVRLYTIPPAMPLLFGNLTLVRDEMHMVVDQNLALETFYFQTPAVIAPGLDIVAEIFTPDGAAAQHSFFIGSNGLGQNNPTYLSAAGCGITEPTDTATIGFPNMHALIHLEAPQPVTGIGTNYCGPAVANSTGAPATILATGSTLIANNNVTLTASSMPQNAFGYFLTSQTQGLVMNLGGGQGTLCLGGAIGRFVGPGLIQNSGSTGSFSIMVNLTMHANATGPIAVVAGETWNYQAWFRDQNPNVTSNLTDGVSVMYQ